MDKLGIPGTATDPKPIQRQIRSKAKLEASRKRFKDVGVPPGQVIVNMRVAGFDASCAPHMQNLLVGKLEKARCFREDQPGPA